MFSPVKVQQTTVCQFSLLVNKPLYKYNIRYLHAVSMPIHFLKILSHEMGLAPHPFTAISTGTERTDPIATAGRALCNDTHRSFQSHCSEPRFRIANNTLDQLVFPAKPTTVIHQIPDTSLSFCLHHMLHFSYWLHAYPLATRSSLFVLSPGNQSPKEPDLFFV